MVEPINYLRRLVYDPARGGVPDSPLGVAARAAEDWWEWRKHAAADDEALRPPLGTPLREILSDPAWADYRKRQTDLASGFGGDVLGGGLAGIFRGVKGAGTGLFKRGRPPELTKAEGLEQQGLGNEEIWRETGWFRGVDGQWRNEISDAGAKVNTDALTQNQYRQGNYGISYGSSPKLSEILEHPELYRAYPDIGEMKVKPFGLGDIVGGTSAAHIPAANEFRLGYLDAPETKKALLHEVQHAVQTREGFARGGNRAEFMPPGHAEEFRSAQSVMNNYREMLKDEGINYIKLEWAMDDLARNVPLAKLPQDRQDVLRKALQANLLDDYRTLWQKYEPLAREHNKAIISYRNLAGEVESRNVEARADATASGFPLAHRAEGGTMDVPVRDQIVLFDVPKPVEHNPFQPKPAFQPKPHWPKYNESQLVPVEHDPFGGSTP